MVSYEVVKGVSLGAGIQVDYFGLKRQTAATPLGLGNFKADDIGVGFVAGITVVPMAGTSIGLGYRSISVAAPLVPRVKAAVRELSSEDAHEIARQVLSCADAPAVRAILRDAAPQKYRFSSIVLGIVTSPPFQMRRSDS